MTLATSSPCGCEVGLPGLQAVPPTWTLAQAGVQQHFTAKATLSTGTAQMSSMILIAGSFQTLWGLRQGQHAFLYDCILSWEACGLQTLSACMNNKRACHACHLIRLEAEDSQQDSTTTQSFQWCTAQSTIPGMCKVYSSHQPSGTM